MKGIVLFCIWWNGMCPAALQQLRLDFYAAEKSKTSVNVLKRDVESSSDIGAALLLGYKGIAEILLCKYLNDPFGKLSHFRTGKKQLENAIAADDHNVELHFLRYTVQTNVPVFLGYHSDEDADRQLLMNYLLSGDKADSGLYTMVMEYMLRNGSCSKPELQQLKKIKG